jgi:PAS domain S-box-containing protein
MILSVTVVSGLLIWYSINANDVFRRSLVEQFQDHQLEIVKSAARGIETLFSSLTSSVLTLASSKYVQDPYSQECADHIREFYKVNQDFVYAGYRMNQKGVLVYMYPRDERAINADISSQSHVVKMFATKRMVVSGLFRAVEGFDAIVIHAPVFTDKKMNGSVATLLKIDKLTSLFLKKTYIGKNGYTWLVDEGGLIIYHPNAAYIGMEISKTNLFTKSVREGLKTSIWRETPKEFLLGDTLFALAPFQIGDRIWTVIISTPYSDISTPIAKHMRTTWVVTIGVLLTLIIGGSMLMIARVKAVRLESEKELLEEKVGLEEELRENHDRLDNIIKTIPSGLFTVDRDNIIRSWNLTAERVTGYSADEMVGRHCSTVFGETCGCNCGIFGPTRQRMPILGRECMLTTKDGRHISLSKNVTAVSDQDGRPVLGIESFIDVTDAKRAEEQRINAIALEKEIEQLRKMDEVKTNFLSMVSHELRTPLSVMLGNLSMAEKGKYGDLPGKFQEKLRIVMRRGWQLNDLIDNLLDLAKIESGRVELEKQQLDIPDAVDNVLAEFQEQAEEKKLRVRTHFDKDARSLVADKNMFRHLLANLISNAIKFTPPDGEIEIVSYNRDSSTVFSVKDSGIGIPLDEQPKIFDRFYQIDNSSTRQYGGTGLGLAIVKEIAQVHNAVIELESWEGRGTEIRIVFPGTNHIVLEHGAPHDGIRQRPPDPASKPLSLLIIDDDPDILTAVTDMVEGSYIRVLHTNTVREAREILSRERPDIIVTDPAAAGPELRDLIASVTSGASPVTRRVILVSSDEDSCSDFALEFPDVTISMPKPFQQDRFAQILKLIVSG